MKKRKIVGFSLFFIGALFSLKAEILTGTIYYISPSGDDTNNGTSEFTPWQSIAQVNATDFAPGDKILFEAGGVYSGNLYFDSADADDATNPITVSSYCFGRAVIEAGTSFGIYCYNTEGIIIENLEIRGSGKASNTGSGIEFWMDLPGGTKLSNIQIKNNEVHGFKKGVQLGSFDNTGANSGFDTVLFEDLKVHDIFTNGIFVYSFADQSHTGYGLSNVTVRRCEVYDVSGDPAAGNNSGSGIIVSGTQNALIEYCTAYNTGYDNTHCGGPVGIWFYDVDQGIIQFNEAYNNSSGTGSGCDGGGFDLDGGVTNSIMQYNYSHDNDGAGFLVGQYANARPMFNNTVRYNISENDAGTNGAGIYLFNLQNPLSDIYIYNNTVYISDQPGNSKAAAYGNLDGGSNINNNIFVYNNLFYTDGGPELVRMKRTGSGAVFQGNLYHSTDGTRIIYKNVTYNSLAAFRTATGNEEDGGAPTGVEADPLLANPGNAGTIGFGNDITTITAYKFPQTSPAVDAGINLAFPIGARDYYGEDPLSGSNQDVGSFEWNSTVTTLTQEDYSQVEQLRSSTRYDDLVIEGGDVELEGDLIVRNLTIANGASFRLLSGNLKLYGNLENNGDFQIDNGELSVSNYVDQVINGNPIELDTLAISKDKNSSLILNAPVLVRKSLMIRQGKITSNKNLFVDKKALPDDVAFSEIMLSLSNLSLLIEPTKIENDSYLFNVPSNGKMISSSSYPFLSHRIPSRPLMANLAGKFHNDTQEIPQSNTKSLLKDLDSGVFIDFDVSDQEGISLSPKNKGYKLNKGQALGGYLLENKKIILQISSKNWKGLFEF